MICFLCGRRLARAAATLQTDGSTGYAGPTCARKAGLLPPRVSRPRLFTLRRKPAKVESGQMEIAA